MSKYVSYDIDGVTRYRELPDSLSDQECNDLVSDRYPNATNVKVSDDPSAGHVAASTEPPDVDVSDIGDLAARVAADELLIVNRRHDLKTVTDQPKGKRAYAPDAYGRRPGLLFWAGDYWRRVRDGNRAV